jgi:hypothetical protein
MCPRVADTTGIEASMITSLGTCRLVMPLSESTIASAGPAAMAACEVGLDRGLLVGSATTRSPTAGADAVVGVDAEVGQRIGVLLEHVGEEHRDAVTEDHRIGDLHHRRLEVQREQQAVALGAGDLAPRRTRRSLATLMKVPSIISPAGTFRTEASAP